MYIRNSNPPNLWGGFGFIRRSAKINGSIRILQILGIFAKCRLRILAIFQRTFKGKRNRYFNSCVWSNNSKCLIRRQMAVIGSSTTVFFQFSVWTHSNHNYFVIIKIASKMDRKCQHFSKNDSFRVPSLPHWIPLSIDYKCAPYTLITFILKHFPSFTYFASVFYCNYITLSGCEVKSIYFYQYCICEVRQFSFVHLLLRKKTLKKKKWLKNMTFDEVKK